MTEEWFHLQPYFGYVRMESRIAPHPTRVGWMRWENRSHRYGDDGSHTVTEWVPGVEFSFSPEEDKNWGQPAIEEEMGLFFTGVGFVAIGIISGSWLGLFPAILGGILMVRSMSK